MKYKIYLAIEGGPYVGLYTFAEHGTGRPVQVLLPQHPGLDDTFEPLEASSLQEAQQMLAEAGWDPASEYFKKIRLDDC